MSDLKQFQEEEKTNKKHTKMVDDEQLSDVSGGGDGWFGRDEAPDGHDIGCWSHMSWYPNADDYCPSLNGFHDYNSGRIEFAYDELHGKIIKRHCKCGKYEIQTDDATQNGRRPGV